MSQDRSAQLTSLVIRYQFQQDPHVATQAVERLGPFINRESTRLAQQSFGMATSDDLEATGIQQCYKCIKDYRQSEGPFLQFAMKSIRGAMLHFMRDHTVAVKIGGSVKEAMYAISRYSARYEREHGAPPDLGQICTALNYSTKRVEDAMAVTSYIKAPKSIDDCEYAVAVGIMGQLEDTDNMETKEGKELCAEVVRLRGEGRGAEDFMVLYGLEREAAVDLVGIIDTHFLHTVSVQDGESLFDIIGALL